MDEVKIQTTKEIDVSHYSDINAKPYKLMFKNFRIVNDNITEQFKRVTYSEYAILGEPIENKTEILDENGEVMLDDQGNVMYDVKIIDNVKFLRDIPVQTVSYDEWFELKAAVYDNLPSDMPEKDKYKEFIKEGIKQTIVNKGFYHGKLTLNDFE